MSKNLYIFDCFGVVVSDVSTLWMNKHFDRAQQQYVRREIFRKVDCGKMSFDASFDLLAKMCGEEKQKIKEEWDECLYPLHETLAVLSELKKAGHTVALLSNAATEYIDRIFTQYGLFGYFDKLFVSSRYGVAKPDREFYRICAEDISEKFDKIFFTDDNPANLQNLQEFGITPVLFTTAEKLRADLQIR